ncbi:uncharacterized protein LOC127123043 [Lathyrus oleraceus]|uniref:uncharacterized protein LOC127123043 n=1 Tax=Pisum sativum TaxID=3888 RepID=UPI0021D20265|nr:uncharacterized protein LOC127123043 [Pisum sativum]
MVAGRNDDALAMTLTMLVGAILQMNVGDRERDADEFCALGKFQRNNSLTFEGAHEPEKAQEWLKAIEKIFRVINCSDAQKRFDEDGIEVTWALFRDAFMEKYFPKDVRGKKEIEILELKKCNGTVAEYDVKFEELIKFCPHYNTANAERSKCLKFVNGLRPDIKKAMGYQKITRFSELVNKSMIYDEDSHESVAHYKSLHDKKGKGKLQGHKSFDCRVGSNVTCYNYGEQGRISTKFNKPKKEQAKGKVFALFSVDTSTKEILIRGTCFINNMPLIAIIDTGAMHSFISLDYAKRLNLELSVMRGSMDIDTPAMCSMTTSSVCLKCPLNICDKYFKFDLGCLPLSQLDVILGMDWLRANHVYINCFPKAVLFLEPEKEGDLLLSTQQVNESVRDGVEVFMLVESLKLSENGTMGEFPVVCDFPEVFPDEVSDLPPEHEVEFTIDLIPGTSLVSMAPYHMSPFELKELKSQLEDLLDKRFIRLSVSPWGAPVLLVKNEILVSDTRCRR